MRYQLKRIQQLHCDLDTAWNFFSSPQNLSRITPTEMGFRLLTEIKGEIYEGQQIDYKITPLLGIPMRWTTLITQVDAGRSFTDFQQAGPYKYWNHYHEFSRNSQGVLMKDTVDYELPMGILGRIAHLIMVRSKLEHIFDYRYQVLERLLPYQNQQK